MRASHKKRLARLLATLPSLGDAERRAVERREELRWDAKLCALIRAAMERRGVDPNSAPALLKYDAKHQAEVVAFVDTPELRAADAAFRAGHPEEREPDEEGDPREWLLSELNRIAQRFLDGSLPDVTRCSMSELWAWAIAQCRLDKARRAIPDAR